LFERADTERDRPMKAIRDGAPGEETEAITPDGVLVLLLLGRAISARKNFHRKVFVAIRCGLDPHTRQCYARACVRKTSGRTGSNR